MAMYYVYYFIRNDPNRIMLAKRAVTLASARSEAKRIAGRGSTAFVQKDGRRVAYYEGEARGIVKRRTSPKKKTSKRRTKKKRSCGSR